MPPADKQAYVHGLLRPDLASTMDYSPVQPLDVLAQEIGVPVEKLCKLNANENLYEAHPSVLKAYAEASAVCHIYPDPDQTRLREPLAKYLGCAVEQVCAGAGADDMIDLVMRAVQPEVIVTTPPTFAMYKFFALVQGACRIHEVPLLQAPFRFDNAGIAAAAEAASKDKKRCIVFLTSPNNPTGHMLSTGEIAEMCKRCSNAIVCVDEAYIEFSNEFPGGTAVPLLEDHANLVILRTFAKWAGLAGLRLGYMAGHPDVVRAVMRIKIPYNLNVGAQYAGIAALAAPYGPVLAKIRQERDRFIELCADGGPLAPWVRASPSEANFVLLELLPSVGATSAQLTQRLKRHGILVRCYDKILDMPDFIRVSIARPRDTDRFLRGLLFELGSNVSMDPSVPLRPTLGGERRICLPGAKIDCVLWDMDGVLADVKHSYRHAIVQTCAHFGADVTAADVEAIKRAGNANNDWIVSQRLIEQKTKKTVPLDEVTRAFEDVYQRVKHTETLVVSRQQLEQIHVPMGIVTGRPRKDCMFFLHEHGLADLFKSIQCMEDGPAKPAPDLVEKCLAELGGESAVFLGDTRDDLKAALASSAAVVPMGVVPPQVDRPQQHARHLFAAGAARCAQGGDAITEALVELGCARASGAASGRRARRQRVTKETAIECEVVVDGTGKAQAATGVGFLDHMLEALAKHSKMDILLKVRGDLHVDDHHTVEDAALTLGQCLDEALGPTRAGVKRFGSAYAPLDEALARAVVDLSGRPSSHLDFGALREQLGGLSCEMVPHFFVSLASTLKATVHVDVLKGTNSHHQVEAGFKAFALALRQAVELTGGADVPSTKGCL